MKKVTILVIVFLIAISTSAQEVMKKIQIKERTLNNIKYDSLNISTLLQVYDEKSAIHLIRDVYFRVDNNGETIAEFYIDNDDKSTKEYYTKIYKNYFLTFLIEDNNKYLIIEKAQFGKVFALSSNGKSTISNLVEIEITNYLHEWGYTSPEEDSESYYQDVNYTLKVKIKDVVKKINFYSSEIKDNFTIELNGYCIQILSDKYKDSLSLIEMIINKKERE